MKKIQITILLTLIGLIFSGCGGNNPMEGVSMTLFGLPAGFLWGIWDGITAPFALIGKLFAFDVNIYEVHNSGNWYNFGFFLGIVTWGASGTK